MRTPGPGGKGRAKQTRTFPSFTKSLEAMSDWFAAEGVTEVVMEATGSYWRSPWYVLEERGFDLKLVNARHVKILPGRKTDVADAATAQIEALHVGKITGVGQEPGAVVANGVVR